MDTFTFALNFSKKLQLCRDLYIKKALDYGSSWRILRLSSLDDQMLIKAVRIKTLRETGVAKVDEPVDDAFIALVNYSLIALIQMRLSEDAPLKLSPQKCVDLVDQSIDEVLDYTMQVVKNTERLERIPVTSLEATILQSLEELTDEENPLHDRALHYYKIVFFSIFALIKLQPNTYIP